jgi:hypothetical protein
VSVTNCQRICELATSANELLIPTPFTLITQQFPQAEESPVDITHCRRSVPDHGRQITKSESEAKGAAESESEQRGTTKAEASRSEQSRAEKEVGTFGSWRSGFK